MMDFDIAKQFLLPGGKYKGQSIDMVGQTDEGLKYLDWLADQPYWWVTKDDFREALKAYLNDPLIAQELGRVIDDEPGETFEL